MISPEKPSDPLIDLPDGPARLAGTLWGGGLSGDAIRKNTAEWLIQVEQPIADVDRALEAIAWAQGLMLLGKVLDDAAWGAIHEFLCRAATSVDESLLTAQPLVHQLLAAELAATLAQQMPDGALSHRMEKAARAAATLGLNRILDAAGVPAAAHAHLLRSLLACWTRYRELASDSAEGAWGSRAQQRYDRFVRHVIRTARPDGRPSLSDDHSARWDRDLLEAALLASADGANRQIAALALPVISSKAVAKPPKKPSDLPAASVHCEDQSTAILRRNWNRDDERLLIHFAGQTCNIELIASGRVVASGPWQFAVSVNGQPRTAVSDWESICWHSDADVDYLELQIELTDDVVMQRHMVLAREDRFLLMADALFAPSTGNWEYRGIVPLAAGVDFCPAEETREGLLVGTGRAKQGAGSGGRPLAHVLPLALPEWRSDARGGQLAAAAGGLELRQSIVGQRLFAPLLLDLDRGRFRRRMTWRQLTVAESLVPVAADRAVGYRVAIGAQQWIIYRSLAAAGNRTLLGHNLSTETLVARFGADGEVTPLIEIE